MLKTARYGHAYVRGSTIQVYQWLEAKERGSLPEGPLSGFAGITTPVIRSELNR